MLGLAAKEYNRTCNPRAMADVYAWYGVATEGPVSVWATPAQLIDWRAKEVQVQTVELDGLTFFAAWMPTGVRLGLVQDGES
jgi:hypothetical protein